MYIDQFGQPMYTEVEMEPPAKRIKVDQDAEVEEPDADADADESDDDEPTTPLPASMRLATKPFRPKPDAKNRAKLLSLFHTEEDVRGVLGEAPDYIDMVIDNQGHTALHWACALAKVSVMTQLIELGADIHRGNYAGETPLIRSVLTTNHAEAGTFDQLLEQLAPSIRTLDQAYRSVLHHVSLIAGVKGRASSARQYMASLLEHVAKQGGATLKTLVDVSDVHGDTALNVAARVGNKGLITLLLDAGADKAKANKLGLRPVDFGVEQEALNVAPAETVVSNLKTEMRPERKARDVQKSETALLLGLTPHRADAADISSIFGTINDAFSTEMLAKQTKLNATEASVRHATRALADKRGQVQRAQAALSEMEQVGQRAENVRRAMGTDLDWAGGASAWTSTSTEPVVPVEDPPRGSEGALVKLRRVAMWEDRVSGLLEERIRSLQGESTDKAVKYRRLVSLCTKVPVDKVDGVSRSGAAGQGVRLD
jgi:ankyrin repeat protein